MKPDRIQKHKTKDRQKGLRAASLPGSGGGSGWGFQETWPLAGLMRDHIGAPVQPGESCTLNTHEEILGRAVSLLALSPVARMLMKEAAGEGWSLGIADLDGRDFHLDVPERQVILDDAGLMPSALGRSAYFLNVINVSLVRALRDAWQEKRHGGFDSAYGPEAILMLERVRAADCDAIATLAAWEIRAGGEGELWRYLIGSDDGDIAMAFAARLERQPAAQFDGQALAVAFTQWYRDIHRVNACDHETLEYLDDVIRGGGSFGRRKLTPVGLEVLSCMPDKTAYLRGRGGEILKDPLFAGLQDEINQLHFLQVLTDMQATFVQGIPFRDKALAYKIFPGGEFTREDVKSGQDR